MALGRPLAGPVGRSGVGVRRPRRRVWMVSPEGFRDLRHGCLLSNTKAAARYLGVCERTIRHWDTGRNRVPWSVVRLLRLLRCGDLGALADEWDGWTLNRLGLHAPVGRTYRERDMRHWWLTCEHARFWREVYDRTRGSERLEGASSFAPVVPEPGPTIRRETASLATPSVTAASADSAPAQESGHAGEHGAPGGRASASGEAAIRAGVGRTRRRFGLRSAPQGAGLVSSLKQVRSQGRKRRHRKASKEVPDAR